MGFEDVMKELKKTYVSELPGKRKRMAEMAKNAQWEDLRNEFHKLKGTGKTYGFPQITTLGSSGENLCTKDPEKNKPAILKLVEELKKFEKS